MLHQLVSYAQEQELSVEPGFAPKDARWAILCTSNADYLGIVELGDTGQRRNTGRSFAKAPHLSQPEMKAGGITKSHFLIDSASVVAAYGKDATTEKFQYFAGLLDQASETMPILTAAAKILRNPETLARLQTDLEAQKAKPTDKVTFQIDGEFPVQSTIWYDWWREFRRKLNTGKEGAPKQAATGMLDFLSGEKVEPAATHPKINGLTSVGGLAMGDVLIGFKQESFRSYGLEQSANAAMSELSAKAYQAGLNDLIAHHSVLLAGTLIVHWFKERVTQQDDVLELIFADDDSSEENAQVRARRLLQSIRNGERPSLADNTYYALTLSSNGGRVVIRDWMEGSFQELTENVNRWFDDLEIVQRDGFGHAKPPKLAGVLAATMRDLKDAAPPVAAKLYRVAARGEPVPLALMAQALARARVDTIQGERPNHARMGLIKAYHLRKWRQGGIVEAQLKPEVNPEFQDRAYHCGRLMAVLGGLQTAALGDVGAGVIPRYYAAASTTPALVFGRLVRGAQPHLSKLLADQKKGLKIWFERQMSDICCRIGEHMPVTLTLEEQSLFALGYYQQLAALWTSTDKETKEKQ